MNRSSTRLQGAIAYGGHGPPQAPQAPEAETVDAEQDSQGNSNSVEMATPSLLDGWWNHGRVYMFDHVIM